MDYEARLKLSFLCKTARYNLKFVDSLSNIDGWSLTLRMSISSEYPPNAL